MNYISELNQKLQKAGYSPEWTILPGSQIITVRHEGKKISAENGYPGEMMGVSVVQPGVQPEFTGELTADEAFELIKDKLEEKGNG